MISTSLTEMKKNCKNIRLWAVVFWIAVWQLGSMALAAAYPHGTLLLASPVSAIMRLLTLAQTAAFWQAVGRSVLHILGGFLLATLAGVLLAALASRFYLLQELLAPLVAAIRAVPVVSFIILALVWLPSRHLSLVISAMMVFPVTYGNVLAGIAQTDPALLEMARVFRVPFFRRLSGIYLPQVLPYFRAGCSLALGLCWKSGVAAEVIGLPAGTIGERLYTAKVYFQTPDLFAWTAVIVLISVLFEHLFLCAVDTLVRKAGG